MTAPSPEARAGAIARRQCGHLTLEQAMACGMTPRMVERRAADGRWDRVVSGLYRVGGAPDSHVARVWAATLATGGVASHGTAAALHHLLPFPTLPHVTVPPGGNGRGRIARVHRSALAPADLCKVDGLPATTIARTLVDLAGGLAAADLAACLDAALDRSATTTAAVAEAVERAGRRRGSASLLAHLEAWTGPVGPESPAEARLVRWLREHGFGGFVLQHDVRLPDGGVARLDVAWPEARVGLEYDGRLHHGPRSLERDERRYQQLAAAGYAVLGLTKLDLRPGERRIIDFLTRRLRGVA